MKTNKAVFLDRDGTINVEKEYLYRIEDFEFLPGVVESLQLLQKNGYRLIIVTNQSGIARGYYGEDDFVALNNWMKEELNRFGVILDEVYYCPHHPNAAIPEYRINCNCRKPNIGMFEKAIQDFSIDISQSFAIGDKIRDCSICQFTDCHGFLIADNEEEEIIRAVKNGEYKNVMYKQNLKAAVEEILRQVL